MRLKNLLTKTNSEVKKLQESIDVFQKHLMFAQITEHQEPLWFFGCGSKIGKKRSFSFTDFKRMTGEIHDWQNLVLSHHWIQTDAITDQPQPGKEAQTLWGSTHSLHTCFSHVAVTPAWASGQETPGWNSWCWPDLSAPHTGTRASSRASSSTLKCAMGRLESMVRTVLQLVLLWQEYFCWTDCYQEDVSTQSSVSCS